MPAIKSQEELWFEKLNRSYVLSKRISRFLRRRRWTRRYVFPLHSSAIRSIFIWIRSFFGAQMHSLFADGFTTNFNAETSQLAFRIRSTYSTKNV
jgi:hypothetical protein